MLASLTHKVFNMLIRLWRGYYGSVSRGKVPATLDQAIQISQGAGTEKTPCYFIYPFSR